MWQEYQPKRKLSMRPYIEGENMKGITVAVGVVPAAGGMIARTTRTLNSEDATIFWYVTPYELELHYEPVPPVAIGKPPRKGPQLRPKPRYTGPARDVPKRGVVR
jgi:hypothetical protein